MAGIPSGCPALQSHSGDNTRDSPGAHSERVHRFVPYFALDSIIVGQLLDPDGCWVKFHPQIVGLLRCKGQYAESPTERELLAGCWA